MKRHLSDFVRRSVLFAVLLLGTPAPAAPADAELAWPKVPECFPSARRQTYEATWLRHNEDHTPDDATRYFRKTFSLAKPLKRATLWVMYDDGLKLWVNGKSFRPGKNYEPKPLDVTDALRQGKNVIAAELYNGISSTGVIARLEMQFQDGSVENLCSDLTWKSSAAPGKDWEQPGFDDSRWVNALSAGGSVESAPWGYYIPDVTLMFTPKDREKHLRIQALQKERKENIRKMLASEKPAKVRLHYRNGSPWITMGKHSLSGLMYQSPRWPFDDPRFIEQIQGLREAGFRFFATGLVVNDLWTGSGQVDEKKILEKLEGALNLAPDGCFMVDIILWAPDWWLRANPDELVGYSNNKSLVWESDNGVPRTTLNCATASYASEKWRQETGTVLRRIIEVIEKSPYASRVCAYRMDGGIYQEWHYYGMFQEMPDNGRRMTERFRTFLRLRYKGDEKALRSAWNDPDVTFDTAQVPDPQTRQNIGTLSLRDNGNNRQVLDYLALHGRMVTETALYFDRVAKKACRGRALTGNFFGYFYSMDFPAEGWHLDAARYADDPASDFAASPYAYPSFFRKPGGSGLPRTYVESFRLRGNKAAFLEADTGTHLSGNYSDQYSNGVDSAVRLLTRDFAQSLIRGAVIWYFDFGNCWYDDPKILNYFAKLPPILQNAGDCSSVSEVAVVADLSSVPYQTGSTRDAKLSHVSIDENVHELSQSGAMFDTILFEDLLRPEADRYKVFFFPASFYMNEAKIKVVERLRKAGKTLVWNFAPGYLNDSGTSLAQMERVTNLKVEALPVKAKLATVRLGDGREMKALQRQAWGPLFFVTDPQAKVLGFMPHEGKNLSTYAEKKSGHGGTDVLFTTVKLTRSEWRRIFREAGVHFYSDNYRDTILANRDYVAVTSKDGGERLIRLPEKVRAVRQLLPEEKMVPVERDGKAFRCEVPAGGTVIFRIMERQ